MRNNAEPHMPWLQFAALSWCVIASSFVFGILIGGRS